MYFLDRGLLAAMIKLVDEGSVLEFGAGKGCYTAAFLRHGVPTRAFDGSAQVAALTRGLVKSSDLTVLLSFGPSDWVVCLVRVATTLPSLTQTRPSSNIHMFRWSSPGGGGAHSARARGHVPDQLAHACAKGSGALLVEQPGGQRTRQSAVQPVGGRHDAGARLQARASNDH